MINACGARESLVNALKGYLVGPIPDESGQEEVLKAGERVEGPRPIQIRQMPSELYHTGILYPSGSGLDPEEAEFDETDGGEEAGTGDGILSLANAMQQSAMGMTFRCAPEAKSLSLMAEWAEYVLVERREDESEWSVYKNESDNPATLGWRRVQFRQLLRVDVGELLEEQGGTNLFAENGVVVHLRARPSGGAVSVTAALVNERPHDAAGRQRDSNLYQSSLSASLGEDEEFVKVSAPPRAEDHEAWNYELLFFDEQEFAVGHGVSTSWSLNKAGSCKNVSTDWIPQSEVFKASAAIDSLDDDQIFELKFLSDPDNKTEIVDGLKSLADAYEQWIREGRESLLERWLSAGAESRTRLKVAAERNLAGCAEQLERLQAGIRALEDGRFPWLWESFCLANEAMRASMLRGSDGDEPRWRPFQLAFILIALPSTLDSAHHDRETLDLIWFPTGGGKTEAYLGLTCAAIFHRRLSDPKASSYGTTVITRYTLRLLTLQQFERAAKVIFACEWVRRERPELLGREPISIGLYAGGDATPNRLEDAKSMINKGASEGASTTLPLDICPWCSTEQDKTQLTFEDQEIIDGRVKTSCPNSSCDFHREMPFWCVDEEIYSHPPTFLIGTVDKFAQLTWEPKSSSLLGGADQQCQPPALIIQDELHLISDSLGSITGLFETAVDLICEARGAKPKVVGSTATIKRAESQSRQLFDRHAKQFPPSGLVHTDSFFYREDRKLPGRLYVGIHAQGRSPKYTLPRIMGLLKQSGASVEDAELRDKFHTLVCYFNSLRELGGALVLAQDDAPRYLEMLSKAGLLPPGQARQSLEPVEELTSNLKVPEIRGMLKRLDVGLLSDAALSEPIGLVLSTNMISVGVDVDRLGCMIVNGQPKTTAEYIQASSRVGRPKGDAGLVVTIYNWTRPRDRSHYERFVGYHTAFYRHVEALTVTPFSSRARDKALHSVFFALARHLCPEVRDQRSADNISDEVVRLMEGYISKIVRRAESVSDEDPEAVRNELETVLDEWIGFAEDFPDRLVWSKYRAVQSSDMILLGDRSDDNTEMKTPQSMRDVDSACPGDARL